MRRIGRARAALRLCLGFGACLPAGAARAGGADRPPPLDTPAASSQHPEAAALMAVARAGASLVAVGERGMVLLSRDEGRHWHQAQAVPVSLSLTCVRFASAAEGWAGGHMGVILHTLDGGEHWTRQLNGIAAAQAALDAAQALPENPASTQALRAARLLVEDGPDKPFLDLQLAPGGRVLAVGAYGLAVQSQDGGATWQSANARFANPQGLHIYHLAQAGGAGFAVGEQGLFLTLGQDGAYTRSGPRHAGTFFGVLSVSADVFLAYGLEGAIYRTADAGAHWTPVPSGEQAGLVSGAVLEGGRIVLGAIDGGLIESVDGGAHFQRLQPNPGAPVSGIVQATDGLVLVGGFGAVRIEAPRLQGAS